MLPRLLCAVVMLLATAAAAEKKWSGNYILLLPKALRPTALSTISVQIQSKNVALLIDSIDTWNERRVTGAVSFFPTGNGVVNYRLPFTNYRLTTIKLAFTAWSCESDIKKCSKGPRLFYKEVTLPVLDDPLFIFTETNKPIYKPGEQVRFRVLPLIAESLQPVEMVSGKQKALTFDIIYLEAPGKVRMAQWRNVSWEDALKGEKLSFNLSADPLFGTWRIVTRINDVKDVETFKVDKYVMSKFVVSVRPPSYIYIGDSIVKFTVCAKYTTKRPMRAKVKANLCLVDWRGQKNPKHPCLNVSKVLNGSRECVDFTESTKVLKLSSSTKNLNIIVNATVIEKGTGAVVTEEQFGGSVEQQPLKIVKLFADTFRPDLPFFGQVQTIKHDGSPIPYLKVVFSVRQTVRYKPSTYDFQEILTSDENGFINFHLMNLFYDVDLKFTTDTIPPAILSQRIRREHSQSRTFIQVYPLHRLPAQKPCSAGKLSLLLQSNDDIFRRTIYAFSTARGNIQAMTSFEPTASPATECEDQDNLAMGHYKCILQKDGKYKIRCLPGWKGPNCRTAICKDGCLQGVCRAPGKCSCRNGWSGHACNKCIIRNGCKKGYCVLGGECRCYGGYKGHFCNEKKKYKSGNRKPSAADLNPIKPVKKEPEYDPASTLEHFNLFARQVDIPITTALYPAAKIVIWFTYEAPDKKQEFVATSISLDNLQDCLSKSTPTQFAFDRKTVRPGESVTARIKTSGLMPKCALTISDVALETFGARNGLSDSRLVAEIGKTVSQMQDHPQDPYKALKEDNCKRDLRHDASSYFQDVDVFVISNIPVVTAPCNRKNDKNKSIMVNLWWSGNSKVEKPKKPLIKPKKRKKLVRKTLRKDKGKVDAKKIMKAKQKQRLMQKVKARVRSFFTENWKFEMLDRPNASLSLKVPDSMTTWKSTMYCVSSRGVGLSPPDRLVVFQPFFLQMALPYSLKRGETAQIPVKVFNYRKECSEIILTMEPSKQLETNGRQSVSKCLCNFDHFTAYFRVRPNQLGKVPIKIEATSRASDRCPNPKGSSPVKEVADAVLRQLLVEAEGMPEEMSFGDLLCPTGKPVTRIFEITAPSQTGLTIAEGSERAYFMWSGNVMSSSLENLDSVVKMPFGCGEQNMISMVPSIYVLDYLNKTGADKPHEKMLKEKALKFINIGYQRELKYRLGDGSFSAWAHDKVGSTWLTAFVFKSFVAATRYVEIDRQVLSKALGFLLSKKDGRGCFREDGRVIHKEMQGGQGGAKNEVAITAYLLGALLEANKADPSLKTATAPAITAAVRCLSATATEAAMPKMSNYGVALRAYALTQWNAASNLTRRFQEELQQRRSSKDDFIFWRGTTDKAKRSSARPWNSFVVADIETTAYALLSLLAGWKKLDSTLLEVMPSVRWLASLRNERGGWFSTQDSLLALQVLSNFAMLSSGSDKGIKLTVHMESRDGWREATVTSANKLVLSKLPLSVPNSLKVTVKGSGCLTVQANVLFNVKEAGRTGAPFSLWASASQPAGRCDKANVRICVRYTGPSKQSGMAIVKARMASGWQVTKASIDALNENVTGSSLKLIEVDSEKSLVLYFDSFTPTNSCMTFAVQRDIEVGDVRPMFIQVYDYYKPHETQERSLQLVGKACDRSGNAKPSPGCPLCTVVNDTAERIVKRLCAKPHFYASMELQDRPGIMLYIHQVGDVIKMWNAAVKLPKACRCDITGESIIAVDTRPRSFSMDEDVALDGDCTVINMNSLLEKGHKKLRESCAAKSEGFSLVYDMFVKRKNAREKWKGKMMKNNNMREEMTRMQEKVKMMEEERRRMERKMKKMLEEEKKKMQEKMKKLMEEEKKRRRTKN